MFNPNFSIFFLVQFQVPFVCWFIPIFVETKVLIHPVSYPGCLSLSMPGEISGGTSRKQKPGPRRPRRPRRPRSNVHVAAFGLWCRGILRCAYNVNIHRTHTLYVFICLYKYTYICRICRTHIYVLCVIAVVAPHLKPAALSNWGSTVNDA